jgi:O-antigen ligase
MNTIQIPVRKKLLYFFPVLYCFCLPFGTLILSPVIIVWMIVSFFNIEKAQLLQGFKRWELWLFYVFFLLTLISSLFSENKQEAYSSIEVKMTFIFFPYLFFCFRWPLAILKRSVVSFVSGCFFACLYLLARALFYAIQGQPEYFFYTMFSDLIHVSYFSMYLILAIIFVLLLYKDWFHAQRSVIYSSYFFVTIFIAVIFLCSSKLGLISFFVCLPLCVLYRFRNRLNWLRTTFYFVALMLAIAVTAKMIPTTFSRLNSLRHIDLDNIDKTSSESTAVRLLIWEQSLHLIRENFLFGTGVADANDELYKRYSDNGLTGALEHKLNAHNQYFQTFIGMGLPGILSLLSLTLVPLIRGIKKKKIFMFFFSLLVMMNFIVESMLQASAGVLFFAFFLCFFAQADEKELKDGSGMNDVAAT